MLRVGKEPWRRSKPSGSPPRCPQRNSAAFELAPLPELRSGCNSFIAMGPVASIRITRKLNAYFYGHLLSSLI